MPRENNFLLGRGERLAAPVDVPRGGRDKNPPYTFKRARQRISSQLSVAQRQLLSVPDEACPRGQVVAIATLHPRYLAKSDFPSELLRSVNLRTIGSKSRSATPEEWGIKHPPEKALTTDLFVAGTKSAFANWAASLPSWTAERTGAKQLGRIEHISALSAKDKLRSIPRDAGKMWLEVVLHNAYDERITNAFEAYALSIGSRLEMSRRRDVAGLTFIPALCPQDKVEELAQFSFLRVLRGMPTLRPVPPTIVRGQRAFDANLPPDGPLDTELRAVIFDGGLPPSSSLSRWVRLLESANIGEPVPALEAHGAAVTSALLFGPLSPHSSPERPYCAVDHVRVLDDRSNVGGDLDYIDVLDRILAVLDRNQGLYRFVNISVGPDLAVNDDEVTQWTAALDERFARDDMLVTVAAGNAGLRDATSGLNRVQPPADGVNVLAVGACDSCRAVWRRASYSCVGPGRIPGFVKPDGVAFGGCEQEPFYAVTDGDGATTDGWGTSLASPAVLRTATGVRAHLGEGGLRPLAIRALLIHRAEAEGQPTREVGWGRFPADLARLLTCDDDEATVVFQGELPIGQHLRTPIPIPGNGLRGMVTISATLVIAPETDPEHPAAYTRSGLEVRFRPNAHDFREYPSGRRSQHPKTRAFFSRRNLYGAAEYDLRGEGGKWEPCIRATCNCRASKLDAPCLDIYYHAREEAEKARRPRPIPYALVIGIKAPRVPDLYNRIVRAHVGVLVPLRPMIQIPIRTTP